MMRFAIAAAGAVSLMLMAAGRPGTVAAAESGPDFEVHKAINIAQWLTWPRYDTGRGIAWPPYKSVPRPPSLAELQDLRRAGFDTVRLPVDPAPFFVFTGEKRKAVYDMLFAALGRIREAKLKVILA